MRCLTALYPQFSLAAVSQQLAGMGAINKGQGQQTIPKMGAAASQAASTPGSAATHSGSSSNAKPGHKYTPARFQGMAVCFGYNSAAGCRRLAAGVTASTCTDGKSHFAHVCNYFLKANNAHCLMQHSKIGNH